MTDKEIEQEIQTKGLTAPRVTPQRIEAARSRSSINPFFAGSNARRRPRIQFWRDGLYAFANAKQKILALEGYALRERMAES